MFMIELDADSYYSFLGISPTATAEEIRAASTRMFREVENRKRATTNPEERRKLEEKQKEIGQKGDLARPDTRAEYDRKNAHLRFFVPQPAAARMYLEKIDRLFALDRAARRFLREKNVNVAPLCDLDRTDFAADQERVDLLERLLE